MPLRIIHCANFNQIRLKGCYLSSMGYKLNNGLTRLNHQVITYSDRDMSRAFGFLGNKTFFSDKKNNENFYQFCLNIKPDALILGHADTITAETLLKIKDKLKNIKILQWNVDSINPKVTSGGGLHNINNIKAKLPVVDYTVITTADRKLLNAFDLTKNKVGFIPNPVDNSIETARVFANESPEYDLFFAAHPDALRDVCGKDYTSKEVAAFLTREFPEQTLCFPKMNCPALNGAAYLDALKKSAMVLNLSRVNSDYLYSSDRMAHAMGNGCLALVDRHTGFADFFSDDEIAFYSSKDELLEKIKFYIHSPKERMKTAQNGHKRYFELFNETLIAKYVASLLEETYNPKDYPFPTIIE
ncbi:MAG: glycosyltransferase family 1 protein [Alphaproteobacteria bacterium]|nr:glycosyltransferase family 1 protein [Alphaproteobacteria bacterium]